MLTPEMRAISTLPLLMARIRADHEDPAVAPDDLALLAHRFDRGSYFHARFALVACLKPVVATAGSGDRSGRRYRAADRPARIPNRAVGASNDVSRGAPPGDRWVRASLGNPARPGMRLAVAGAGWFAGHARPGGGAAHLCRGRTCSRGLVPGRQDPRPARGDRDRELEVGGQRAVLRVDRPLILADPHGVPAGRDHRLDGEHHPLLERNTGARVSVVGDLGLLVHLV